MLTRDMPQISSAYAMAGIPRKRNSTIEHILDKCAFAYGLSRADILMKSRTIERVHARQMAMIILKDMTSITLLGIGRIFNKDHTTVIHGIKAMKILIAVYPDFKATYDKIVSEIEFMK